MAESYNFRSAIGGFNKEDVVRYMEFINNKHANHINQMKTDMAELESQLQQLRRREGLEEVLADLRQQYALVEAERNDALAALESAQQAHDAEVAALKAQLAEVTARQLEVINRNEEELEAYRRAEQTERQARQRAEQLCAQAQGILADAGVKADESAQRIGAMADQAAAQLSALQQAVISSKSALQEAALSLYAIAPKAE